MIRSHILFLLSVLLFSMGVMQCGLVEKANATSLKKEVPVTDLEVKKPVTEELIKPVTLTEAQVENAGVRSAAVSKGDIYKTVELLGEVVLNEESTCHISPRYTGAAVEVKKRLGDTVEKGEILAIIENKETFTKFKVISPIAGHIVEKHINRGEIVSEDSEIFIITDLSKVWIEFDVNLKDAEHVRKGQSISIKAVGVSEKRKAVISFVSPVLDPETRCIVARAEISNKWNRWKPGMFVKGTFTVKAAKNVKRVLRSAVQVLNQKNCVFIPTEKGGFIPVYLTMVTSNKMYAHIECDELKLGDIYITKGSFELKSRVIFGDKKASCPCC